MTRTTRFFNEVSPFTVCSCAQLNACASRTGHSLVELIVLLPVISGLMTITMFWIHSSMQYSRSIRSRVELHQSVGRLSSQLRNNISDSNRIDVQGNDLTIHYTDRRITYSITTSRIERSEELLNDSGAPLKSGSGDVKAVVKREFYEIGDDVEAVWGVSELPDWVSLTIQHIPFSQQNRLKRLRSSTPPSTGSKPESDDRSQPPIADQPLTALPNPLSSLETPPVELYLRAGPFKRQGGAPNED